MFSKTAAFVMAAGLTIFAVTPAFAGQRDWKVDRSHSYGEVSAVAKINESPVSVTLGAASVAGTLRLDQQNIENSSFEFDVEPADAPAGAGTHTVLRYRSGTAKLTRDGKLRVSGPLTVTEVRLESQLDGNEAYSGPQFNSFVVKETTREVSFDLVLPGEDPVDAHGEAYVLASADAQISTEDFPELVAAVLGTNWPAISNDKTCASASAGGEDYSGYACTGSSVGQASISRQANSFSEDYPGEASGAALVGNNITLALHLRLTREGTTSLGGGAE